MREFLWNSRHPHPRRARKPGLRPRPRGPFPEPRWTLQARLANRNPALSLKTFSQTRPPEQNRDLDGSRLGHPRARKNKACARRRSRTRRRRTTRTRTRRRRMSREDAGGGRGEAGGGRRRIERGGGGGEDKRKRRKRGDLQGPSGIEDRGFDFRDFLGGFRGEGGGCEHRRRTREEGGGRREEEERARRWRRRRMIGGGGRISRGLQGSRIECSTSGIS